MLHSILSLRWITLVAALGAALGAMLMFFEGCLKLAYALEMVVQPSADSETSVIATVMQATDAFLFGLVLIVFAYAITFGFAFNLPDSVRAKAPLWMQIEGLGEIKITLIQVVLVYLVVDFVTDVVEAETRVTWELLVKPTAIVLIAVALRLLGTTHLKDQPDVSEQLGEHPKKPSTALKSDSPPSYNRSPPSDRF
jgi:uncharacterized membrane protein YqhA